MTTTSQATGPAPRCGLARLQRKQYQPVHPRQRRAELNARYDSQPRVGPFKFQPCSQVGGDLKKEGWGGRGTLKLAAADTCYPTPRWATFVYTNYRQELYFRRNSRGPTLFLGWRFGNDQASCATHRNGSAEHERPRAQ